MNLIAKLLMNSLYGKFGMKSEKTVIECYNNNDPEKYYALQDYLESTKNVIQDIIDVGGFTIIVRNGVSLAQQNGDMYHGVDVNIAVASAVTSGARIIMSKVKNNPNFNLYYTDTDSIVVNSPLPEEMVGSALGQFKLEYEINDAVFLAPKVYAFLASDGTIVKKVKGVAKEHVNKLSMKDFSGLLVLESSLLFKQDKWFKDKYAGSIEVAEVAYELKATSNKRQARYLPLVLSNGSEVNLYTHSSPINYSTIESEVNKYLI